MTFKEKLKMEHPVNVSPTFTGGCFGCPFTYGYERSGDGLCKGRNTSGPECGACWNREMPGIVKDGLSAKVLIIDEMHAAKTPEIGIPDIKKVIFNDPATIVIWADGEKTVVKCQNGEPYDPEKGLAMAITKRALGNKGNYFDEIKKWTKDYDVKCAYPEIVEIHMDETESNKLEELVRGMVKRRKIGRDEV